MKFYQVISQSLDAEKNYYALNSEICDCPPLKFAQSTFAAQFPEDIKRVKFDSLRLGDGTPLYSKIFSSKSQAEVYVSTLFGVIGGLIRSKGFKENAFINSPLFNEIIRVINAFDLGAGPKQQHEYPETPTRNKLLEEDIKILKKRLIMAKEEKQSLEKQMEACKKKLLTLKIMLKQNKKIPPNSGFPPTPDSDFKPASAISPTWTK